MESEKIDSRRDAERQREGNAAELRAALLKLIPVAKHGLSARVHSLSCTVGATNVEAASALVEQAKEAITNARAALASPARNCDVGTAEEQENRYVRFCDSHMKNHGNCFSCAALKPRGRCEFAWAQLPCTESEAK